MKAMQCVLWQNCSTGAVTSLGFLCGFFFWEQLSFSSFLFPLLVDWRVAEFPKLCWDGFEVFDLAGAFWERCQGWQLFVLWDVPNVPLGADSVRIPWEENSVQLCLHLWASFIISFTYLKLWFHNRSARDPLKVRDGVGSAKMPFLSLKELPWVWLLFWRCEASRHIIYIHLLRPGGFASCHLMCHFGCNCNSTDL